MCVCDRESAGVSVCLCAGREGCVYMCVCANINILAKKECVKESGVCVSGCVNEYVSK